MYLGDCNGAFHRDSGAFVWVLHATELFDGRGDVLKGRVHYQPWLDERPGDVPLERLWDRFVGGQVGLNGLDGAWIC